MKDIHFILPPVHCAKKALLEPFILTSAEFTKEAVLAKFLSSILEYGAREILPWMQTYIVINGQILRFSFVFSNCYFSMFFSSSKLGILPALFILPSTISAGVVITPKLMILAMSVTFSI